jgi:hypothetical protein
MSTPSWSFSKLKAFETCPKQFYHVTVLKQYPFKDTDATLYGKEFHKACEDYIGNAIPIPEKFAYIRSTLEALNAKTGEKLCEYKLGLTVDLEPCDFFSPDVWFRGIADLLILNHEDGSAYVVDYKTGKSSKYADKGQLELMALAVFAHFPNITKVRAGLLFVVANDVVRDSYEATDKSTLWGRWISKYKSMEKAFETNVWNAKPSGLCRQHCPVLECPHNGRN